MGNKYKKKNNAIYFEISAMYNEIIEKLLRKFHLNILRKIFN